MSTQTQTNDSPVNNAIVNKFNDINEKLGLLKALRTLTIPEDFTPEYKQYQSALDSVFDLITANVNSELHDQYITFANQHLNRIGASIEVNIIAANQTIMITNMIGTRQFIEEYSNDEIKQLVDYIIDIKNNEPNVTNTIQVTYEMAEPIEDFRIGKVILQLAASDIKPSEIALDPKLDIRLLIEYVVEQSVMLLNQAQPQPAKPALKMV